MKIILCTILIALIFLTPPLFWRGGWGVRCQTTYWSQKADYGSTARVYSKGFSIGSKGYVGTGEAIGGMTNDFWEYDPGTDAWTQLSNFPGVVRQEAVAFSIGSKGYVGLGRTTGSINQNDLWEYDPGTNSWAQKANFIGTPRHGSFAFAIGTKGYVGTGDDGSNPYEQDFYEYNPATDTWTPKANFGGGNRFNAATFTVGTKGYVGTGFKFLPGQTAMKDFWEYNPATDTWTQKTDFLGVGRVFAVGFSIGNKGYIGTGDINAGYTQNFFEYDPSADTLNGIPWMPIASVGGSNIYGYAAGFSIGDSGYIINGYDGVGGRSNQCWCYGCDTTKSQPLSTTVTANNVTCNGICNGQATVTVSGGTSPYTYQWNDSSLQTTSVAIGLCTGTYSVVITDSLGLSDTVSTTINQPDSLSLSISATNATCGNADGSASVSVSGGASAYSYFWNNSQTTATATGLAADVYSVTVTDTNGCSQTQAVVVNNIGAPTATVFSTNASCNNGSDGTAAATTAGGTSPYTYSWSNSQTTQTATGLSAGTYTVTITDANGCTVTTTATVTQPANITTNITLTAASCNGYNDGNASISASGGTSPYIYQWSNGTIGQFNNNLASGNYTVIITDSNGCTIGDTVIINQPPPVIADISNSDTTISMGATVQLFGSGNGSNFLWSPAQSLSCTSCQNPFATASQTTVFYLTVSDVNGCSSIDSVTLIIDIVCGDVFIPNVFSPNGDSQNDKLFVRGNCIIELYFAIYDRWGENVFETTDQTIGWDGTYRGKMMNTAVFVYLLKGKLKNGNEIDKKGNITLLR